VEKIVQTVGSQLREVRESLGIQLEEAANVTRIGKNYLNAIEGDMFDKLPSPAYVKGFLRVYAGFLGLSGDEVVARYDSQTTHPPLQSSDINDKGSSAAPKTAHPRAFRWLTPILAVFSIAVVIFLITDKEDNIQNAPPAADLDHLAAAPVLPIRSSAFSRETSGKVLSGPQGNESISDSVPPSQDGIILKLKVNQDCWLNITIDGSLSQQYDLKAGDLIEWKGRKVFALDLGNAGGVEAELNGKPLASFGGQGMTAHVVLTGNEV
jgi:cytoskeleton protein RodZ